MNESLLKELSGRRGNPCVTVILALELKSFADKEKLTLRLKKAVTQTEKKLSGKYDAAGAGRLVKALRKLVDGIDLKHPPAAAALFLSPGYARLVALPFPAGGRTVIAGAFDVSDVEAALRRLKPYVVLLLSKGKTRLFRGEGPALEEVINSRFPVTYENEFQVGKARPAKPGMFHVREESQINRIRLMHFYGKVDRNLVHYLGEDRPLIVMGVHRALGDFRKVSRHAGRIAGRLTGNYDKLSPHELSGLVWPVMEKRVR